jgi:hypothetical protein
LGWLDRIKDKKELEKIPPELRDASPEDIVKKLADAEKLKADHAELQRKQAESDTKVQEISTAFEDVKTRLAAAEANRNKPPDKKVEGVEPTPENMLENPKGVLDTRLAPLEGATIRNGATMSRMLAQQQLANADMASGGKTMDGRLFQAWGAEIDAESRKYQAVTLMTPEAWLGIYWYLKGLHGDELRDPDIRKKKYAFLEPASSSAAGPNGPGSDSKPKDGPESLTDQEKHVADKMGVSYENYAKRRKAMVMVNV